MSRFDLIGAWGGFAFLALFTLGFWPLCHFLPPHDPAAPADAIAALYRANALGIRVGIVCMMFGAGCYLLFILSAQSLVRQLEASSDYLSRMVLIGGATGSIYFITPAIIWGVAAFRPERAADLTQLLNDMSWLLLATSVPPFLLSTMPLALGVLFGGRSHPLLPRWYAYVTLWGDMLYIPGICAYFFKSGPFAWSGLFPYWLPLGAFGGWVTLTCILMMRVVAHDARSR